MFAKIVKYVKYVPVIVTNIEKLIADLKAVNVANLGVDTVQTIAADVNSITAEIKEVA